MIWSTIDNLGHRPLHYDETAPRLQRKLADVASALVGITVPFSIIIGRASLAFFFALITLAIVAARVAGLRWQVLPAEGRRSLILLLLGTLLWLPSVALSLNPLTSLGTWLRTEAVVVALVLIWAFIGADQRHSRLALKAFVASAVMMGLFTASALFVNGDLLSFRSLGAANPRLQLKASASVVACTLPILIFAGKHLGRRWMFAAVAACALGLLVMAGSQSRSSLAGVLIATVFILLLLPTRQWNWRSSLLLLVCVCGVTFSLLAFAFSQPPARYFGDYAIRLPTWLIDNHRQIIWQFALERFAERPWFGWGLNASNQIAGGQNLIPGLGYEFIPSHPHNWVVQLLTEAGVIGFVPTMAMVVWGAVTAYLTWRREGSTRSVTWLSLWLVFWTSSMFNFSFWALWWTASAGLLGAVLLSVREKDPE